MEDISEDGTLRLSQVRKLGDVYTGYSYFWEGDVLVAKITPCFENGKGAIAADLENGIGFGTTELHVLRPGPDLDRRFLLYLTLSQWFRDAGAAAMTGAAGQKRVPDSFIRDLKFAVPPLDEQRAIAEYLDEKTAAIDALIAKRERHIELLAEKAAALIADRVTRGLDDSVLMSEAGDERLGFIPVHWDLRTLKYVATLQRGFDLPSGEREDGDIPLVSSAGVSDRHVNAMVKGPGVVTGRYGTIGEVFFIEEDFWPLNTTLYVKDFWGNSPRFVAYLLSTLPFDAFADKSAVPGVNRNDLHTLRVPVPPRHEQDAIVAVLNRELREHSRVANAIRAQIDKLREYRQTLISAAVTGQIPVREEIPA
jgi:type I restriction enzyme S subunit